MTTDETDRRRPMVDHDLLVRLDERTSAIQKDILSMQDKFVSKVEFEAKVMPIQKLLYGVTFAVLLSVITLVLKSVHLGE